MQKCSDFELIQRWLHTLIVCEKNFNLSKTARSHHTNPDGKISLQFELISKLAFQYKPKIDPKITPVNVVMVNKCFAKSSLNFLDFLPPWGLWFSESQATTGPILAISPLTEQKLWHSKLQTHENSNRNWIMFNDLLFVLCKINWTKHFVLF